jgi:ribonuclease III
LEKAAAWLKATLDYQFGDPGLLEQALTHRSAAGTSNERLEFLGDAVLDVVVSEAVFRAQPFADEGDLSRLRASIVRDVSLAEVAAELGIGVHLVLGSGEKKSGGHRRESILADAIEALFGAVYLDAGFDVARQIVERALGERLRNLPDPRDLRDPKTRLQEWLQSRRLALPEYELVSVGGKAHRQVFEVLCHIEGDSLPTPGTGSSRRSAEQQAAQRMLDSLSERPGD